MEYLCYQENLLILFLPTWLLAPIIHTVTGVGPPQYTQRGRGQLVGVWHLSNPCSRVKTFIFFRDQSEKKYEKLTAAVFLRRTPPKLSSYASVYS